MNYNWEELLDASDENLPWDAYDEIVAEANQVQETYLTARSIINDAQIRYKKKKLNARNKKQVEDMKLLFADLEDYNKKEDIHEAYGWNFITEAEMKRLYALWEKREQYVDENGKYSDPVTELLDSVMDSIYKPYAGLIALANRMTHIIEAQKKEKMLKSIMTSLFQ